MALRCGETQNSSGLLAYFQRAACAIQAHKFLSNVLILQTLVPKFVSGAGGDSIARVRFLAKVIYLPRICITVSARFAICTMVFEALLLGRQ